MEFIVMGAVGAMIVLGSFLMGASFAAKLGSCRKQQSVEPVSISEEDRVRMLEDQRAFESLLQYNIDMVYGRNDNVGGRE